MIDYKYVDHYYSLIESFKNTLNDIQNYNIQINNKLLLDFEYSNNKIIIIINDVENEINEDEFYNLISKMNSTLNKLLMEIKNK